MKARSCLSALCGTVLFSAVCAGCSPPAPGTFRTAESREEAAPYVEGIEALRSGNFNEAAADLVKATAAGEENADYLRARGVAGVLTENFPQAITGLERAVKLRADDAEAKLWLAAAYLMNGDPAKGSMNFSFNGVPHNYADLVYNVMAMDYWSSRVNKTYYDRVQRRQVPVNEAVKTTFPEAARAYAERHLATGARPNKLVMDRMKSGLRRGDWTAAWNDLAALRRNAPEDISLRKDAAECLLGFGDALHAREEFTRVLCVEPLWGEGYLGRARAAAMTGDRRRAEADLKTAKELRARGISAAESAVRKAGALPPRKADEAFRQKALSETSWEDLVNSALALHRQFNDRRFRYDEGYQDRVLAISDAIRVDRKNADRRELLARFLFDYRAVPVIWNGPRATEQLRPQSAAEQDGEVRRALEAADEALKIDPRHVNALVTKAYALYALGRPNDAEALADKALKIEPYCARALGFKSYIVHRRADQLASRASALRSGRSETHTEHRSDGVYMVTTRYEPTAEELAEAAQCEAEAAQRRQEAAKLDEEAGRVRREMIPALLKKGKAQKAAVLDADMSEVKRALAEWARKHGDAREKKMYALMAEPIPHTTAADELKTVWENIIRTAWPAAEASLDAAGKIDPADARVSAYRSVLAAARQDAAAATRQRTASLALEEARARLMGTSFVSAGKAPLRIDESGLTLVVRQRYGDALAAEGRNDRALEAYQVNQGIETRADKDTLWALLPTAMLPDTSVGVNAVQEAPSLASLTAWARLGAGRALLALGRPADAQKEFLAVRAYLANWPMTAEHRETMNVVDSWARLGIAEAAIAAGDYETAAPLLVSGEGWPWGLPKDLEARKNALTEKFRAARNQVEEDRMEAQRRMTPEQRIEQSRSFDDDQFQKQREQTLSALQDPNLSPADRRALEASLAELDRVIATRKRGGRTT